MKDKNKFKVLEGGLSDYSDTTYSQIFQSAWVTDTRLMGVLCMYAHWQIDKNGTRNDLHQYFYFDAEELGFDRFEWVIGNDKETLMNVEVSMIGGLGGTKVAINMPEAVYLLKKYMKFNREHGIPVPESQDKFLFMTAINTSLSKSAATQLFAKCCVRISSEPELLNYFIMRHTAGDSEAVKYLSSPEMTIPKSPQLPSCTLYKNDITFIDKTKTYRCESLIGNDEYYHLTVSTLEINNLQITDYHLITDMGITDAEAYLNLSHHEFITIYKFNGLPESFSRTISKYTRTAMIINEHGGTTFMIFHQNNEHVAKEHYRLYEDLIGIYHLTGNQQLIAASNDIDNIGKLELDLTCSSAYKSLKIAASYEFNEPVLMQYLESDYSDFDEFINAIKVD